MSENKYDSQVSLVLDVLPLLGEFPQFALKGGTAINLFYRHMPRRSVDIDLVYLPLQDRDESLKKISVGLENLGSLIKKRISNASVISRTNDKILKGHKLTIKLEVSLAEANIIIEPNLVLRGAVYAPTNQDLCKEAQDIFEKFTTCLCASFEDVYAGKICAALDRQHPRDFFDVKLLLETEGISSRLRDAFIVYLCGHNRPVSEVLRPRFNKDFYEIFTREFEGMTTDPVIAEDLVSAFKQLQVELFTVLKSEHRSFLLGFAEGKPDWSLISEIPHAKEFPSIKWKLLNIEKMDKQKRSHELAALAQIFA